LRVARRRRAERFYACGALEQFRAARSTRTLGITTGVSHLRHLVTLGLLFAAAIAYFFGIGPLFFGAPLLGWVLVLTGLVCELVFWYRLRHSGKPVSIRNSHLSGTSQQ
jgi:FtsH-binding integral membrane protein